jgi:hypothetical protein
MGRFQYRARPPHASADVVSSRGGLYEEAMRTVRAVRYVLPLREGGSVPALVEADDLGLYVVKLRGAGQGPKALVAELITGELARAVGLPVPELVLVDLDVRLASAEPDAFTLNVDRTPRNPNLLVWHRKLWLIDHGASLYFHHGWGPSHPLEATDDPFHEVRQHVLLSWASALPDAAAHLQAVLIGQVFARILAEVPDAWLDADRSWPDADAHRAAYVSWLERRLAALPALLEEAQRARG